jgi:hypothetical protein
VDDGSVQPGKVDACRVFFAQAAWFAQDEAGFALTAIWCWVRSLLYYAAVRPVGAGIRSPKLISPELIG